MKMRKRSNMDLVGAYNRNFSHISARYGLQPRKFPVERWIPDLVRHKLPTIVKCRRVLLAFVGFYEEIGQIKMIRFCFIDVFSFWTFEKFLDLNEN